MAFLASLGATLAYFALAFGIGWLVVLAYDVITPSFKVWPEIQRGNLAVALSLGGQIIGGGIVLYSAIIHNAGVEWGVLWTIIWALLGGGLQIFGFLVFELSTPKMSVGKELAGDNRAVGFVAMSIAIALGIIVAACIS